MSETSHFLVREAMELLPSRPPPAYAHQMLSSPEAERENQDDNTTSNPPTYSGSTLFPYYHFTYPKGPPSYARTSVPVYESTGEAIQPETELIDLRTFNRNRHALLGSRRAAVKPSAPRRIKLWRKQNPVTPPSSASQSQRSNSTKRFYHYLHPTTASHAISNLHIRQHSRDAASKTVGFACEVLGWMVVILLWTIYFGLSVALPIMCICWAAGVKF